MGSKSHILALFEQRRGRFVSGEGAAAALGISRAAVWKAVQTLRSEGFAIEAVPGSGYRLAADSDFLSEESLHAFLPPGVPVQVLAETSSTNIVAKQWAMEGAPHGSLVVALRQTGGRGRLGRRFDSPPGGIYMSVVLRPGETKNPVLITAAAAVATCRAVGALCGKELSIKWVNDLFYEDKKCCGILTEAATSMENGSIEYLVVGIGVNYTIPQAAFAPEIAGIVSSLYPDGNAPAPRAQLCARIYTELLACFATLGDAAFLDEYRRRSLVLGRTVTVLAKEPYDARAVDIDDEAHLVVETPDGARQDLSAGEISVRL